MPFDASFAAFEDRTVDLYLELPVEPPTPTMIEEGNRFEKQAFARATGSGFDYAYGHEWFRVELDRAWRWNQNPALQLHLARIDSNRRTFAGAVAHYREYLAHGSPDKRAEAERELGIAEAQTSELAIDCRRATATVTVDDVWRIGTCPFRARVRLDPGTRTIAVDGPGGRTTFQIRSSPPENVALAVR